MERPRSKSLVQEKSFRFAVDIVAYARRHQNDRVNLVLTRQLLRSGTSIGANVEEALGGQSRKDFIAKLAIAAKEARETGYWLRLIRETQPHNIQELACLLTECDSLKTILNSIILTTRSTLATQHSELRSQNPELRTPNSDPRSPNSELRTPNQEPPRT
ncbi:MAG: four helix bundle protein [Nitrospira sp. CG24E]|nr:MAG: four helix bundle protein [Nitrospira sp. CG24E]